MITINSANFLEPSLLIFYVIIYAYTIKPRYWGHPLDENNWPGGLITKNLVNTTSGLINEDVISLMLLSSLKSRKTLGTPQASYLVILEHTLWPGLNPG